VTNDDLVDLMQGKLISENFLNLYFKILEKMNLVLSGAYNYRKQQVRNGSREFDQQLDMAPEKVLFY